MDDSTLHCIAPYTASDNVMVANATLGYECCVKVALERTTHFIVASALLAACLTRPEVIQPSEATESTAPTEPRDAAGPTSAVSAPEPADGGAPIRGLNPEQIRTVVMSKVGSFQQCYEDALAKDPELRGAVAIAFSIAPDGTVKSADVASSSLGNPAVESCMVKGFQALRFPTAEKPTNAVFPFAFKGRR